MDISKPILLVDDSDQDIELIAMCLKESGGLVNTIDIAGDGEEALDYLYRRGKFHGRASSEPAVIFLDLKMPKIDGFEVLSTIKSDEKLKSIPVVILTSSRENRDIARSYAGGANAYVVKPLDSLEFMDTIKQACLFWINVNVLPA